MYLRLLGGARLESDSGPVRGRAAQRRRLGLLALLAASPVDRPVSRERVISLLWPESNSDAARRLLSESLYVLRKELGDSVIIVSGDEICLNHEALPSDVAEFRHAMTEGDLERAKALYGGPFLDAWYVDDAAEFERWVEREREALARSFGECLLQLADRAESGGDWPTAVRWCRELSETDRYSARFAIRLAEAQVSAGQRAAALQTLSNYETALRDEMDLPPEPAVVAYVAQLRTTADQQVIKRTGRPRSSPTLLRGAGVAAESSSAVPPAADRHRVWWPSVLVAAAVLAVGIGLAANASRGHEPAAIFLPKFDPNDVAVRPFVDLTGKNASMAYALTDELILRLTGVAPIRVASRNAVLRTQDSTIGIDSLARALHVGTIIEGTVRESGGKVSVVVLVTDVGTGRYVGATQRLLIQVCLDADADPTWEREVRALATAAAAYPDALPILITGVSTPPQRPLPAPLTWRSAADWLLGP